VTGGTIPAGTVLGVLLPVRIETRFTGKLLRLRVVPDEPWLDRHDPLPSAGELDAVERFWAATGGDLTTSRGRQAWRELAAQVGGGARAAWLTRSFPIAGQYPDGSPRVDRPPVLRTEPRFPELPDFPEELEVWLARDGQPPAPALTLRVDRRLLRADLPDPRDPGDRRWWESWDEAVAAGLAGEIELGDSPDDIDALYVVGLGDGDPARLFAAHSDAGRLGLLAPGRATNTVDGAPAADLAEEPDRWLDLLGATPSRMEEQIGTVLTGRPGALGALPGDVEPHGEWSQALVSGLWPALWGFAGKDVWAVPGMADAAEWAPRALFPEGPYPTVRVGVQPYGLLPATALRAWVPAKGDPAVEAALPKALGVLRDAWAAAAEARGTIEGVDTGGLMARLGQVPTAPGYRHRNAWPLELWLLWLLYLGYPTSWPELDQSWSKAAPLAGALGLAPLRRYAAKGGSAALALPLVVPADLKGHTVGELLRLLLQVAIEEPNLLANTRIIEVERLHDATDSLLLKLAIRSVQLAVGDVGRARLGEPVPALEQVSRPLADPGRLATWIGAVSPPDLTTKDPEALAFQRVERGLAEVAELAELSTERLERLLRATVDCASHRVDAWVSAPPARRLGDLAAGAELPTWRLGAYGWVDAPKPGTPGPTAAGFIQAPTPAQAVTAMVLRDRALNDAEPERWRMNLTSTAVRAADRLGTAVRGGAHLAEALGREVERAVGDRATISRLRRGFPIRAEHAGRRVCDGQAVLAAPPATLNLPARTLAQLDALRAAVDAYGDLLVAEAVHDVVEGRAEAAGAAMDAAAGLGRPPELSVLRTRREGRGIATSCAVALDAVAPPAKPADPKALSELSPGTVAEPALAAFLRAQLGQAPAWTWTAGGTAVTLAQLGLEPVDALALSLDDLERLVATAGGGELTTGEGSARYRRAVRLVAMLGRVPAVPDAVAETMDETAAPADPGPLRDRYTLARSVGAALLSRLQAAATASAAEQAAALTAATRWGIAPEAPPGAADALAERVARAAGLLATRLAAAPADPSALAADDLVRALVALVSATGQVAVLGRLPRGALPGRLAASPGLDAWLTVTAAVREPLARLEAHRLTAGTAAAAGPALVPWSNRPSDPWQTDDTDARRLVAVYAPAGLDLAGMAANHQLAVALLDRWAETVPSTRHATSVVFGFDAPAARPQQAILLAVPPDLTEPLDARTVLAIVEETRALAHARMARPADLAGQQPLVPTALLPGKGPTRVRLDSQDP
jgi:hypothetical protein